MPDVAPHAHCRVCGISIPPGDVTCGMACAQKRREMLRNRALYTYLFLGACLILLVSLIFGSHL